MTPCDRGAVGRFGVGLAVMLVICGIAGMSGPIGGQPLALFGSERVIPAGRFMLLFGATGAGALFLFLVFPRRRTGLFGILAVAVALRLVLLPQPPSDDLNRYLWEGRLVREGINPYRYPPDHGDLIELARSDPYHAGVNHPDVPAAYPPLALMLFALVGGLWYDPMAVKWMVTACDVGTLALVVRLLRRRGLDLRWSLLYALNPVVLYGFAGQGHFDALQMLFLTAALVLYDRRAWTAMFLCAGLAIQCKYVAVLAVPFLVRPGNRRCVWIGLLAVLAPFLPFAWPEPAAVFSGLIQFGGAFAVNGPMHTPLRWVFGGMAPATAVTAGMLLFLMPLGWWVFHPTRSRHRDDPVSGAFFALGLLIVCSPTVHFWYLSWIVPFLAIRPSAPWLVLCLTIGAWFAAPGVQQATGNWALPTWAFLAQWVPFAILLARQAGPTLAQFRASVDGLPARTVTVIVPAIDEAAHMADGIRSVLADPAVREVIVVDGGSRDGTAQAARRAGARVLTVQRTLEAGGGRGGQVLAGLTAAGGDVVAVVHADTRVTAPAFTRMCRLLARQPMIVGGALGGCFEGDDRRLRWLETANDFKSAFLGLHFGDQVQFFRRQPVVAHRAYPGIPLMEDVELSLRLSRLGRQTYLFGDARISPRKWQAAGFGRSLLIIRLVTAYLVGRRLGTVDTAAMYRRYYGVTKN